MGLRAALLLLSALAFATQEAAAAAPVALTEATFDHQTSEGVWFIKFYAPWCGHCKKLAPVIEAMAEDPVVLEQDVHVGKVDCTAHQSICERFGVGSYPTLKVVSQGRYYDYNGRRDAEHMIAFATEGFRKEFADHILSYAEFVAKREAEAREREENERKSAVVTLTTESFEDLILESKEPWLVKFYAPWCGHCKRLAPTWNKLSLALKESGSSTRVAKVDCTVHRRVCSRFGVSGYPSLFYVNAGNMYRYKGGRTLAAFQDYVESGWEKAESLGPIPEEGFFSKMVDMTIEWAAEHTVLAILAGILAIAIVVAILVAMLDYWLGADDVAAYQNIKPAISSTKDAKDDKKAKKTAGKPKEE